MQRGLWRDSDKQESWANTNCIEFNKSKCWMLCLGRSSSGCRYSPENGMLQSSPAERELGVLANSKENMKGQGGGLVAAQLFTEAPAEPCCGTVFSGQTLFGAERATSGSTSAASEKESSFLCGVRKREGGHTRSVYFPPPFPLRFVCFSFSTPDG